MAAAAGERKRKAGEEGGRKARRRVRGIEAGRNGSGRECDEEA